MVIILGVMQTIIRKAYKIADEERFHAEAATKAKSEFLANMSHEIRTPMNAEVGIAEILDTMELTQEQQKRYIKIILNSTNSLLTIINDILDFSKIEAVGKVENNKFDIVLMDVQMPVMNGLEASQKIREMEKNTGEHVTIIALTADVMEHDIDNCLKAGMDNHLPKPIKVEKLYNVLLASSPKT